MHFSAESFEFVTWVGVCFDLGRQIQVIHFYDIHWVMQSEYFGYISVYIWCLFETKIWHIFCSFVSILLKSSFRLKALVSLQLSIFHRLRVCIQRAAHVTYDIISVFYSPLWVSSFFFNGEVFCIFCQFVQYAKRSCSILNLESASLNKRYLSFSQCTPA